MENFVHRRDLITSQELRQFVERSNRPGLVRLLIHLILLGVSGTLVWLFKDTGFILFAWIGHGIALAFIFSPLHECIHGTAFHSKRINIAVATAAGFLLLLPANYFRFFHFQHHRYTNDPKHDPELLTAKPDTLLRYIWAMTGITSYWWPQIRMIATHSSGRVNAEFIPEGGSRKVINEARLHVLGYSIVIAGSVITGSDFIVQYWIVPMLIGMIALRLFLLAEHTGCEYTQNMLLNTRTTLTNPAVRLITWNMPFHCEHHLFPAVPFYKLADLHERLGDRLSTVTNGYSEFHANLLRSL